MAIFPLVLPPAGGSSKPAPVLGLPGPKGTQQGPPQTGGQAQSQAAGQSDWQHLFIRLAEFIIGGGLIWIGIGALVRNTKPVKATINIAEGFAGGEVAAATRTRRAANTAYARQAARQSAIQRGNGG
jgi:hypothetical protein